MGVIIISVFIYVIIQVGILLFFKGSTSKRKDSEDDETTLYNIDKQE